MSCFQIPYDDLLEINFLKLVRKHGLVCLTGCKPNASTVLNVLENIGGASPHWEPSSLLPGNPLIQINDTSSSVTLPTSKISSSQVWHTDGSFLEKPPNFTVLLCLVAASSGAGTEFIDMRDAIKNLSTEVDIRKLVNLLATHEISGKLRDSVVRRLGVEESKRMQFSTQHPLLRSQAGRKSIKSLYYNPLSVKSIDGVSKKMQLGKQIERAILKCNLYTHKWRAGDCLVWDNSIMLHRKQSGSYTGKRLLYRGLSIGAEVLKM